MKIAKLTLTLILLALSIIQSSQVFYKIIKNNNFNSNFNVSNIITQYLVKQEADCLVKCNNEPKCFTIKYSKKNLSNNCFLYATSLRPSDEIQPASNQM